MSKDNDEAFDELYELNPDWLNQDYAGKTSSKYRLKESVPKKMWFAYPPALGTFGATRTKTNFSS